MFVMVSPNALMIDGEDEAICDRSPCPLGCVCLGYSILCDGVATLGVIEGWKVVHMQRISITSIPVLLSPLNLVSLNVSNNYISELKETDIHLYLNMISLDVSYNQITNLTKAICQMLSKLNFLYLSGNSLHHLEEKCLSKLKNIRVLELSETHISKLSDNDISGLLSLQKLSLQLSDVSDIDLNLRSDSKLSMLNISYTPLSMLDLYNITWDGREELVVITTHHWVCCLIGKASCLNEYEQSIKCDSLPYPLWVIITYTLVSSCIVIVNLLAIYVHQRSPINALRTSTYNIHLADMLGAVQIGLVAVLHVRTLSAQSVTSPNIFTLTPCIAAVTIGRVSQAVSLILSAIQAVCRLIHITSLSVNRSSKTSRKQWLGMTFVWLVIICYSVVPNSSWMSATASLGPVCSHVFTDEPLKRKAKIYLSLFGFLHLLCSSVIVTSTMKITQYIKKTQANVVGSSTKSSTR